MQKTSPQGALDQHKSQKTEGSNHAIIIMSVIKGNKIPLSGIQNEQCKTKTAAESIYS